MYSHLISKLENAYTKQIELKGEIEKSEITAGNFNTSL